MKPDTFDFIIIGGGSAGYAAAKTAHKLGLRTALIEGGERLGGLCLLRGCMPSKALLESANRFREMGHAADFGLRTGGEPRFLTPEVIARKRRLVDDFAGERAEELQHGGFQLLRGQGKFIDAHTVEFTPLDPKKEEARSLTAKTFLLATGSRVKKTDIKGLAEVGYLTSSGVLDCERSLASVVVLGAGPVGLEAAHYYRATGAEVTVLHADEQILAQTDEDVSTALEKALTARGMTIHCQAKVTAAGPGRDGCKRVSFQMDGKEHSVEAEEIIFAIGREPCTEALNLPAAGVELDKKHHAAADPTQRTSAPHIFAAGDVCGPYEILHLAVRQGEIAARNAARQLGKLAGKPESCDHRLKLTAVFTEPEMAAVGLTEKEATETKRPFRAESYPFAEHGRAIVEGAMEGLVKLIADPASGEILGAAAVGPRAAELIHEMVAVMYYRGKAADIVDMPHYHPTLSEIWTYPAEKLTGED